MSCKYQKNQISQALGPCTGVPAGLAQPELELKWWELTEEEFFQRKQREAANKYLTYAKNIEDNLAELKDHQTARRTKLEETQQAWLTMYHRTLEEPSDERKRKMREEYKNYIKKEISRGRKVPDRVLNQPRYKEEFRVAVTSREIYEKGWKTSFANRSAAIDDSMQRDRGYKVKRQDGSAITNAQIEEINQGMDEINAALDEDLSDIYRMVDLTISHTNGKHPFLDKAMGGYMPSERTATIGVKRLFGKGAFPATTHEVLGHMLDFEAGQRLGASTQIVNKSRTKVYECSALSEEDSSDKTGDAELIRKARWSMNQPAMVKRMSRRKYEPKTEGEQEQYEVVNLTLGAYWESPREIWARLCEQYVSTQLRRKGYGTSDPVGVKADYTNTVAYWSEEQWSELEPLVKAGIKRRLEIMRASEEQIAILREQPRVTPISRGRLGSRDNTIYNTFDVKAGKGDGMRRLRVAEMNPGKWQIWREWYDPDEGARLVEPVSRSGLTQEQAEAVASNLLLTRSRLDEDGQTIID